MHVFSLEGYFTVLNERGRIGDDIARLILMSNTWSDSDVNERCERKGTISAGHSAGGSCSQPPGWPVP